MSYPKDSRVIGHRRRRCRLRLFRRVLDSQILHVATSKYNVLVDVVCRWNFVISIAPAFCTERGHVLECDDRFLRVDFMKSANESELAMSTEIKGKRFQVRTDLMSLLEIRDIRDL